MVKIVKKTLFWLLLAVGIVFAIGLYGSSIYITFFTPSEETKPWQEMSWYGKSEIESLIPPQAGETYQYYYSESFLEGYKNSGSLITDQRVVYYFKKNNEVVIESARYDDITDASISFSGITDFGLDSTLIDSDITITQTQEPTEFKLLFSPDHGYDQAVLKYIRSKIKHPLS